MDIFIWIAISVAGCVWCCTMAIVSLIMNSYTGCTLFTIGAIMFACWLLGMYWHEK